MRSTVELPEDLMRAARDLTGLATKREIIELALSELVRQLRVQRLIARLGKTELDLTQEDLERMRAED